MKARALSRAERGEEGGNAVRARCSASSRVRANILHYKYIAQARTRLDCDERLEKMREVNAKHHEWFSQHEGARPPKGEKNSTVPQSRTACKI